MMLVEQNVVSLEQYLKDWDDALVENLEFDEAAYFMKLREIDPMPMIKAKLQKYFVRIEMKDYELAEFIVLRLAFYAGEDVAKLKQGWDQMTMKEKEPFIQMASEVIAKFKENSQ